MTLKELRQKLAEKRAAARALLTEDKGLAAKANLTDAETTRRAAIDTQLEALETEVETLQAQLDAEEKKARRESLFAGASAGAIVAAGMAARSTEPDPARTFGFKHLAEFARAVYTASSPAGAFDPRLNGPQVEGQAPPASYQQNQGSGGEGFLVPPEYSKTVWDMALDPIDLLGMCQPEPTESNAVLKPKDETTPWGSSGVQAYWAAEAGQYTPSAAQLKGELMTLHKLFAFVPATDEIMSDAPMLKNRIGIQSGKALRWKASDVIFWGTGAGQPTGFMNSPALITQAKDSGQATGTISVNNLLNMLSQLLRTGQRPVWLANPTIIPQLGQLVIPNTTMPAWLPFNGPLQGAIWDGLLLGYPLMFTEHAQGLSTAGDIVLITPDGYYAVTKQNGIEYAESMHLYFDYGLAAFRWTFRMAGQPHLSKPVVPPKGSTSRSHFIALATR